MSLNTLYRKLRQAAANTAMARVDLEAAAAGLGVEPAEADALRAAVASAEAEEQEIRDRIVALLDSV